MLRYLGWIGFLMLATPSHCAETPNVVLIVADDLGVSDLGCYGSKFHKTPNLDALAERSRRFAQAYAAASICSPSRAALMTGLHPARLHLTDWLPGRPDRPDQKLLRPMIHDLPRDSRTLAESLKAAGYTTAHIGKWHLGGQGSSPTDRGFDLNIAGDDRGSPASYQAPFRRNNNRVMPGLEGLPDGTWLTDYLSDQATKFIDAQAAKPFFLYVPYFAVHTPLAGQAERIAHYPAWDGTPHGRQENPIYAAMLEELDAGVGRILDALKRNHLSEQTIVIFTSDNGGLATREGPNTPATSNSPFREGKGYLYEGGIRVPLIVSWPDKIAPGVDETPVWGGDILPTIEAMIDVKDRTKADGVSLDRLLLAKEPIAERALFWHYPHYSNQGGKPGSAIRDGRWKLVEFAENGRRELFDVAKDPVESRNLAEREPEVVTQLAAKLATWKTTVDAQVMRPNPDFVPNPQADDGTITLPGKSAEVHGTMLRFEPLPHKETLGYWVQAEDWASWEFEVKTPGTFEVIALVGCGTGSGGSEVDFRVGDQVLKLNVPETGGFQKFEPQRLGRITLEKPGRKSLEVRPVRKPKLAVMDLRQVRLVPIKQ